MNHGNVVGFPTKLKLLFFWDPGLTKPNPRPPHPKRNIELREHN